jgi:hypothetical protein
VAEPALTTAFLGAYSRADEASAEGVASPLYAAEWERRGLATAERQALLTAPDTSGSGDGRLQFDWVGGLVDNRGFAHLLFTARPRGHLLDHAHQFTQTHVPLMTDARLQGGNDGPLLLADPQQFPIDRCEMAVDHVHLVNVGDQLIPTGGR